MPPVAQAFPGPSLTCSAGLAQSHVQAAGSPVALAAPARLFCTDNFIDKTSSEGRFDFSEWVRAYGKYLEEQVGAPPRRRWHGCRPLTHRVPETSWPAVGTARARA